MKKVIFSCNVGGYDNTPQVPLLNRSWHKILLTDEDLPKSNFDEVIILPKTDRPDLLSKKVKWLPHLFLPDYQLYCWYDSNMRIFREIPAKPFRILHPKRKFVAQEVEACIKQQHRWTKEALEKQYNFMLSNNFQDTKGLFLNGFHCRLNSDIDNLIGEQVVMLMEEHTTRDQIAFPYILEKLNYTYNKDVLKSVTFFNSLVRMSNHKLLKPTIYG